MPNIEDESEAIQDDDEELVGEGDVVLGDPIVGLEAGGAADHRGVRAREARPLPAPREPTAAQRAKHDITHLPYESWCEDCIMAKRPNEQHRRSHVDERVLPLLVGDYGFVKDSHDDDSITLLVLRLLPYRITFAMAVPSKGPDPRVVARIARFIRECGLLHFTYRSDREPSITSMFEDACRAAGSQGKVEKADANADQDIVEAAHERGDIPVLDKDEAAPILGDPPHVAAGELTHPGESQSNGLAERGIQLVEDQVRVLKIALERAIGARVPSEHPVLAWMVEHASWLLSKFVVSADGTTGYGRLHGREGRERIATFGEKVAYYTPKKQRSKLDPRWRIGVFLGRAFNSDQNFIGRWDGSVVRARGMARLIPSKRWDAKRIERIMATPMSEKTQLQDAIEEQLEPHANRDDATDAAKDERLKARLKITAKDLREHGFTDGCRRCYLHRGGMHARARGTSHTEDCRARIYGAMRGKGSKRILRADAMDPDIVRTRHQQPEVKPTGKSTLDEPKRSTAQPPSSRPVDMDADDHGDDKDCPPTEVRDVDDDDDMDMYDPADYEDAPPLPPSPDQDDDMFDDFFGGDEQMPQNMVDIANALMTLGVDALLSNQVAKDAVKRRRESIPATFFEVFGRGGVVQQADNHRNLNIKGLNAMDIRTLKPDGTPWNFNLKTDRQLAIRMVRESRPTWLICSPPCTAFCQFNIGLNYKKMDPARVAAIMAEGRSHLRFVIALCRLQLKLGGHFLHEHPAGAASWSEPEMKSLLAKKEVSAVVSHQCEYGLVTPTKSGKMLPAKKPTRWASSSPQMLARLSRRCQGKHEHQSLVGGRAAAAAFYSPELTLEILRGMRDTADALEVQEEERVCHMDMAPMYAFTETRSLKECLTNDDLVAQIGKVHDVFKMQDGSTIPIKWDQFKPAYKDEYTSEELPTAGTHSAIMEELNYFNDKVWVGVDIKQAQSDPVGKVISSRWVNCNKGDAANPDIRCRLVACEVNHQDDVSFYAATPPLEAKRLLFSEFASQRSRNGQPLQLSFVDVKKAYFNGTPTRSLYIRLPKELGLPSNVVGKLVKCMYGCRDSGAIWEHCYADALTELGFLQGKASPCAFYHPVLEISVVVHGDDFTALGTKANLDKYEEGLKKAFDLKIRGRLGEGKDDDKEIRILNRIVTITPQGLRYEADPRHAELLSKSLDLMNCRFVSTPGVKHKPDEEPDEERDLQGYEDSLQAFMEEFKAIPTNPIRKVSFKLKPSVRTIRPYSEVYGSHPRSLTHTRTHLVKVDSNVQQQESTKDVSKVQTFKCLSMPDSHTDARRALILRDVLINGAAWQVRTSTIVGDLLCAMTKKKKFTKKRIGAKAVKSIERLTSVGEVLNGEEATLYRALAARANYLSLDRPEIAFATKELCRDFAQPTKSSIERLKRLVRYLTGAPRLMWNFDFQQPVNVLRTYVDTDFAGCYETRRSTSGGAALRGSHLIRHWSSTQSTVALSSGEAELGGICKGTSISMGLISLCKDLGLNFVLEVHTDATAAIGMCRRRGLGKVRHLATADLWVQDKLAAGDFTLHKVLGTENPADMLTKHLSRPDMLKCMAKLALQHESGRAASAPDIAANSQPCASLLWACQHRT